MTNNFTPPTIKRERDSNIELYRIIAMLLIVAHHFVVNSGVMGQMDGNPSSWRSIALYLEGAWGKTGINCFVLITGWFMCKSHITLRKFLKLFLQVEFYNIICTASFWLTGYHDYTFRELVFVLWPIGSISHDFVSCYLIFFLFIPFLNILVQHMTRHQHLLLMMLCLGAYTVLGSVPIIGLEYNYVTWFCILYIISSWLRLYDFPHKNDVRFWAWAMVVSVFFAVCSILAIALFIDNDDYKLTPMGLLNDSHKFFAVLAGVTSFMLFVNIRMPRSRFINSVVASTFGVLLIHANSDVMRQWLWQNVCDVAGHYNSENLLFYMLLVPITVFTACILIDHIRRRFLEEPVLDWIEGKIRNYK